MLKRLAKKIGDDRTGTAKDLLVAELSEVEEISEKIFSKIDSRIRALVEIEKRLDMKISHLESLVSKTSAEQKPLSPSGSDRRNEIAGLAAKGLKVDEIAGILDMPKGEVELILSLGK